MARIQVDDGRIPPTTAQQMFTLGSAIAGGLAGIITARALANKADVPLNYVVGATAISALFTVGAAMMLASQATKEF